MRSNHLFKAKILQKKHCADIPHNKAAVPKPRQRTGTSPWIFRYRATQKELITHVTLLYLWSETERCLILRKCQIILVPSVYGSLFYRDRCAGGLIKHGSTVPLPQPRLRSRSPGLTETCWCFWPHPAGLPPHPSYWPDTDTHIGAISHTI